MRLSKLIASVRGPRTGERILSRLQIDPGLRDKILGPVPRAVVAMALNAILFDDLLQRVPTARSYVEDLMTAGGKVVFDHGALRTIHFGKGAVAALPDGESAFTRILEPLGYAMAGVYPLDRLKMTGRAYRHLDFPETIPQFFLSELHVERFSLKFGKAAHYVFDSAADPIDGPGLALLYALGRDGAASAELAVAGLPSLVAAFGRQHDMPHLDDYRALLTESAEAAWIATEGNVFNHATDRVADVAAVAQAQRDLGRDMKETIEISSSGRVRQTAFRADPVARDFRLNEGIDTVVVPGSFYEFISRDDLPDGRLDLDFDPGNAQGIFAMTRAS